MFGVSSVRIVGGLLGHPSVALPARGQRTMAGTDAVAVATTNGGVLPKEKIESARNLTEAHSCGATVKLVHTDDTSTATNTRVACPEPVSAHSTVEYSEEHEEAAVKIQANFKGYRSRKKKRT